MRYKNQSLLCGVAAKRGLRLFATLAIMLLFNNQIINAQQTADTPVTNVNPDSVSGIASIEAQEADDEATGTIDSRSEPYMVIQYIALEHQIFLPMVVGGSETSVGVQSAAETMPWPPSAPLRAEVSPEQQAELEASFADAEAYVKSFANQSVSAAALNATNAVIRSSASVGGLNTLKEPNDFAHRNYCGPGAIQVTMDAQMAQNQVPGIEAVKDRINSLTPGGFDPSWGTTDMAMCKYLYEHYVNVIRFGERYLQQPSRGTTKQTLWNELLRHVGKNYTIPTGAMSLDLKQWSRDAAHITALIGYDADIMNGWFVSNMYQVRYAETSGSVAGYTGSEFKIWYPGTNVWNAIGRNNTQCLLKAGV